MEHKNRREQRTCIPLQMNRISQLGLGLLSMGGSFDRSCGRVCESKSLASSSSIRQGEPFEKEGREIIRNIERTCADRRRDGDNEARLLRGIRRERCPGSPQAGLVLHQFPQTRAQPQCEKNQDIKALDWHLPISPRTISHLSLTASKSSLTMVCAFNLCPQHAPRSRLLSSFVLLSAILHHPRQRTRLWQC